MTVDVTRPAATAAPAESSPPLPFTFHGRARDYFAIWIVNLLLTVLTLGIWSAWAKVRRLRYFYGNTQLAGTPFDYLADGWTLLKGRLLVVLALAAYTGSQFVHPFAPLLLALAFVPLLPWVINRSLRFNARMTVWRNVRLDFAGSYWGAAGAFIGMPLLGTLTAGLLYPLAARSASRYLANNYRFGTAPFAATLPVGPFYGAAILALALFFVLALLVALPVLLLLAAAAGLSPAALSRPFEDPENGAWLVAVLPLLAYLVLIVGGIAATSFFRARVRNVAVNHLALGRGHRFDSRMSGLRFGWIILSNTLVSLFSLGLLYPWAAVRAWRYQADCLTAMPAGSLDAFADAEAEAGRAFGSEFAALQDIEVGL